MAARLYRLACEGSIGKPGNTLHHYLGMYDKEDAMGRRIRILTDRRNSFFQAVGVNKR